jgi:hypothetical protein
MGFETGNEKASSGSGRSNVGMMTLQRAVDLGEYDPDYLANFPEWHTLSRHVQFQMIRRALDKKEHQLVVLWAEINNVIDFSKKPHLRKALENIEEQKRVLMSDRERLYLEYTKV